MTFTPESLASDDVLVHVEGVRKRFCRNLRRSLWYGIQDIVADANPWRLDAASGPTLRSEEFWAVDGVSFELRRGECVGLIGRNGAGKTTLLKMLNGLIRPDGGRITIRGRVGALIALGAGFNPVLTGRENIYVNGAVLGLTRREIDERLDAIIAFADIGEFIDAPVQSYSSGMHVRLGFAVASQLEPDVLLIDEVLAVGDMGFRAKCYGAIARLLERAAVIFVSHSMEQVSRICSRALVLNEGGVRFDGDAVEAAARYSELFAIDNEMIAEPGHRLLEVAATPSAIQSGDGLNLRVALECARSHTQCLLKVNLLTGAGTIAAEFSSFNNACPVDLPAGRSTIDLQIPDIRLLPQRYFVSLAVLEGKAHHVVWSRNIATLTVTGRAQGHQPYQLAGRLSIH